MTRLSSLPRLAVAMAVTMTLLAGTGCSWFRKGNKLYRQDAASRPLEVPPDLDMPRGNGAGSSVMASDTGAASPAPARPMAAVSGTGGFTIAGTREAAFDRVGKALEGIDGVTIVSRAQLLGAFDVSYGGSNFLVRVVGTDAGAYVSTVDPRGQPANAEAPTRLISALKTALGAN